MEVPACLPALTPAWRAGEACHPPMKAPFLFMPTCLPGICWEQQAEEVQGRVFFRLFLPSRQQAAGSTGGEGMPCACPPWSQLGRSLPSACPLPTGRQESARLAGTTCPEPGGLTG